VIYPLNAGVASAFGLMVAPHTANFVQTYKCRTDRIDWTKFNAIFEDMSQRAGAMFDDAAKADIAGTRSVDFRYVGQGFEISVELPDGIYSPDFTDDLNGLMRAQYARLFGRVVEGVAFEVVNLRLIARAARIESDLDFDQGAQATGVARKGARPVYFLEAGDYVDTDVFDRHSLLPGVTLNGPALIEEVDTTIVIPPGASARIDAHRNVIATLSPQSAASRAKR
jgi:N-methylhydantoinase A